MAVKFTAMLDNGEDYTGYSTGIETEETSVMGKNAFRFKLAVYFKDSEVSENLEEGDRFDAVASDSDCDHVIKHRVRLSEIVHDDKIKIRFNQTVADSPLYKIMDKEYRP